jgi:hypothetical protein
MTFRRIFLHRALIGIGAIATFFLTSYFPVSIIGFQPVSAQENPVLASDRPLPATVADSTQYGTGIQRTLYHLATSTPTHRHTIRILFYGQSITKQDWWIEVIHNLQQHFPNANLIVENRAIGGFASPLLVRTAKHDLYPFYPDLTIFHVYGDEKNYEAIIAKLREQTTSEVLITSDHITWLPNDVSNDSKQLNTYQWHNNHAQWLKALAKTYGCEFVDIREAWRQYLKQNALQPNALLVDDVHLNKQGNQLMARLVTDHMLQSPVPSKANLDQGLIDYRGDDLSWQDNSLTLEFTGNRIDLIQKPASNYGEFSSAQLLIDGKSPSQFPSLYRVTRPSDAPGVDWPGIIAIESAAPLIVEDWTLIITAANAEMTQFSFDLYGSKTGFDGSGTSQELFVSNSKRVMIKPENWWLGQSFQFTQKPIPIGFQIRWQVQPMFMDIYTPLIVPNSQLHYPLTIAQNLTNSRHTLEIHALRNAPIPIAAIRVYRPQVKVLSNS